MFCPSNLINPVALFVTMTIVVFKPAALQIGKEIVSEAKVR